MQLIFQNAETLHRYRFISIQVRLQCSYTHTHKNPIKNRIQFHKYQDIQEWHYPLFVTEKTHACLQQHSHVTLPGLLLTSSCWLLIADRAPKLKGIYGVWELKFVGSILVPVGMLKRIVKPLKTQNALIFNNSDNSWSSIITHKIPYADKSALKEDYKHRTLRMKANISQQTEDPFRTSIQKGILITEEPKV